MPKKPSIEKLMRWVPPKEVWDCTLEVYDKSGKLIDCERWSEERDNTLTSDNAVSHKSE